MRQLLVPAFMFLLCLASEACGPGVIEGELPPDIDEPECSSAIDGLGEECSLSGTSCRCGHVCGEEPFVESEDYLTHYCFAECNSMDANPTCPGQEDICVPLGSLEDMDVCLQTGVLEEQEWVATILPGGYHTVPVDIGFLWDGVHHDASQATASVTDNPEQQDYVVLTFAGEDDENSIWFVQVQVRKEHWNKGTYIAMDIPETNPGDFGPVLRPRPFSAKLFRESGDRVWIEAIAIGGGLDIVETGDSCFNPEECWVSRGTVELTFAGYRAEIDIAKFPPRLPGSPIPIGPPPGTNGYKNIAHSFTESDDR